MTLVDSLISAMIRSDGEALVLHVGEKPYVVSPAGNVEISTRELTYDAVVPMLNQLLSDTKKSQLDEVGAVQDELTSPAAPAGETFTVVVARGGEDVWIELRRHRVPVVEAAPEPPPPPPPPPPEPAKPKPAAVVAPAARGATPKPHAPAARPPAPAAPPPAAAKETKPAAAPAPPPQAQRPLVVAKPPAPPPIADEADRIDLTMEETPIELPEVARPAIVPPPRAAEKRPSVVKREDEQEPRDKEEPPGPATPAVVVPMRRPAAESKPHDRPARAAEDGDLERLLRLAASRNATTLYVVTNTKPSLRIDGQVRPLDMEPTLSPTDVEALVLAMMPEGIDAVRRGTEAEWVRDIPEIGRVRCTRFRDHRGPGAIFQFIGARAISADELGLPRGVRELADEAEGLILITGPRASGKSTLFAALVDLINRSRSAHIITLESQIKFVHENRQSIVSQREVRGDHEALLAMARTALREGPDVLAIEDLRARESVALAMQAAETGHLVIGIVPAANSAAAIERILGQVPDDRRSGVQRTLSDTLRAVVSQVLVRKIGGGRAAARELLLNTPHVSALIADGDTGQLFAAIESGRRAGMVTMNESLVDLVRSKITDVRDAYRYSSDRDALVKLLKREGIDTSFVERMA